MKHEVLDVAGVSYPVRIRLERRTDSYVSIGKNGVNVRLPLSMQREELFRELLRMKEWARQKISEEPLRFKPPEAKRYRSGSKITVGVETYRLNIVFKAKDSSSARLVGNEIQFVISSRLSKEKKQKHIATLLSRCIAQKRLPELQKRIEALNAQHFGQKTVRKIFFKLNKSNWGSCSAAGNINISTRLLFAKDDVLDYVCIHELAHLIEQNHSDRFWALVEKAMPDYKEKEKWLKENGGTCGF